MPLLLFAIALSTAVCCGRARRITAKMDSPGGAGASVTGGGESNSSDGGASRTGAAGAPDSSVDIDAIDCAARPLADCSTVDSRYDSNEGFEHTPAFAACEMFNSFDGCGVLEFAFDAEGCAISVSPGPGGWKYSQHLAELQACLAEALQLARFSCLASGTLKYTESCFIP